MALPPITSQRTGRQRLDGSLPVGNSRNSNARLSSGVGSPVHDANQAKTFAPTSEPPCTATAYPEYSSAKMPTTATRPVAQKSQPIGLRGCRETTRAPTAGSNTEKTAKGA